MKTLPPGPHLDLLMEALDAEAGAQRALLAREPDTARHMFEAAERRYRASYECAPPASYGRLIGMLKAAVLAGDPADSAAYVRDALRDVELTPPACYASAIAALVAGDDAAAIEATAGMRAGDAAFGRAADAVAALATRDREAYAAACHAIVADFEGRTAHLTGVPIADTAAMFEVLAGERGIACSPESALMPGGKADANTNP